MGQNMMLKGLTVRLAFFRRPFLNVANSKINRPFVFFLQPIYGDFGDGSIIGFTIFCNITGQRG